MRIHKKITQLERELNSEVVIQEEVGHSEHHSGEIVTWPVRRYYDMDNESYVPEYDEWIVDKPEITEPNIEARIKARIELINLKYTLWFFQYKARERIDELLLKQKSKDEIELEEFYNQIEDLERGLRAEIVVQEERGHEECTGSQGGPCSFDKSYDVEYIIDTPEVRVPDLQKREASIKELKKLYEETIYKTAKNKIEKVLSYKPE